MLKELTTIAIRRFVRERLHFAVSLISLSVGFSGIMVLAVFLESELSYDQHHVNHENIYRLITRVSLPRGRLRDTVSVH